MHDVVLRFDLPYCIHLQDGMYDVALGKRLVKIETRKSWRNSKDCSNDDSVGEEKSFFPEASSETGPMGESFEDAKGTSSSRTWKASTIHNTNQTTAT